MANKIIKNKKQYMLGGQGAPNSRAGDEAALEALYTSTNGASWTDNTGWASSGMSLGDNIYGVTTAAINGELRVTELDLKNNNLTGNIENSSIGNLKEMELFNVCQNNMFSRIPPELFNCTSMKYCYLCISDETQDPQNFHPHEEILEFEDTIGAKYYHTGKTKGNEQNVWYGALPSEISNLSNVLEYFILTWTDDWTGNIAVGASPNQVNGIDTIPPEVFDMSAIKGLFLTENWNIADNGNRMNIPATLADMRPTHISVGGGSGTSWDEDTQEWLRGNFPDLSGWTHEVAMFSFSRHGYITNFPDLRNLQELKAIGLEFTQAGVGIPIPSWLVDGRFARGDLYALAWPNGNFGSGFTGGLPEFGSMDGMDLFSISGHGMTGEIPHSFFTTNPNGIKKFDLRINNFTSLENNDLTNLSGDGRDLNLYQNDLSGQWPYVDWNNYGGTRVRLQDNKYVFSDMLFVPPNAPAGETCLDLYKGLGLSTFNWASQQKFGSQNNVSGNIIDFSTIVTHTDNEYSWTRDGSSIAGDTATLDTGGVVGDYVLTVTNSGAPELTLTSVTIIIE